MKKLFFLASFLLATAMINAQTLNEIVSKYTAVNKYDKISAHKTIKITAKMNMMGQDMPLEIWMKNPGKIRQVINFGGQEMIQTWDGQKGYMINPMAGSADPIELPADQAKNLERGNAFSNFLADYLKDGKLTLLGEEAVNGKPAFKIKADISAETPATMYIDKVSYYLVKTTIDVNQNGQEMTVESYPSDYTETNGILLPMKTTTSMGGMDMVMTFDKVEIDIPMDDSLFVLKK